MFPSDGSSRLDGQLSQPLKRQQAVAVLIVLFSDSAPCFTGIPQIYVKLPFQNFAVRSRPTATFLRIAAAYIASHIKHACSGAGGARKA